MKIKSLILKAGCAVAVLAFLLLGAGLVLVYPIFKVNRPPAIVDAFAFVQDCQDLVDLHLSGDLKLEAENKRLMGSVVATQWPTSVASLKPRALYVRDDRVIILISTGGIDASFGYLVPYLSVTNFADLGRRPERINGVYMSKTKHKNVYFWRGIE